MFYNLKIFDIVGDDAQRPVGEDPVTPLLGAIETNNVEMVNDVHIGPAAIDFLVRVRSSTFFPSIRKKR